MITKLDGTKLLPHSELYLKGDDFWLKLIVQLLLRHNYLVGAEALSTIRDNIGDLIKFEDRSGWDIILKGYYDTTFFNYISRKREAGVTSTKFYIEYKSNLKEWGKNFHRHLRQINKRGIAEGHNHVVLLTFDDAFEKYRVALKRNNITLFIIKKTPPENPEQIHA